MLSGLLVGSKRSNNIHLATNRSVTVIGLGVITNLDAPIAPEVNVGMNGAPVSN